MQANMSCCETRSLFNMVSSDNYEVMKTTEELSKDIVEFSKNIYTVTAAPRKRRKAGIAHLGKRFKEWRQMYNQTLASMSKYCFVSESDLKDFERGLVSSLPHLKSIANGLLNSDLVEDVQRSFARTPAAPNHPIYIRMQNKNFAINTLVAVKDELSYTVKEIENRKSNNPPPDANEEIDLLRALKRLRNDIDKVIKKIENDLSSGVQANEMIYELDLKVASKVSPKMKNLMKRTGKFLLLDFIGDLLDLTNK